MAGSQVALRLLGPVEVWRHGTPVPAGGPTQRAVLAMLALHAGRPVPVETLSEGIWGEADEPAGGARAMQVHVARLRPILRVNGHQPLQTVPGGYRLDAEDGSIDSDAFERALADGRRQLAAGDAAAAVATLTAALALWRGPALMDLRDFPFAAHDAARYDELRTDAAEAAIAARLALGEHQALVSELKALISANPYRERLHAQLMTALYRAGQQAAALDAFQSARNRLVLDLGVEPGPELAQLQQRILAQDPALAAPAAVSSAPTPTIEASRASPPTRLPPAPVLFGRETLLAELEELARGERLLTLTGAGGSGKTVLATALAHRLAPDYPDGAAFVDLAAVSRPDQVLPALAAALGVTPQGGSLAELLAEVLAEQRRLVVLDNCEHLLAAVPDLSPLVQASAGLVIATSRSPLGLRAERVAPVPPLPLPAAAAADLVAEPAVALFVRAAANAGIALDPDELPAVAAICHAVDGLPLAIELVAAQTRVEAATELAATLHARLPALAASGRDIPDRQRTMQAAIGWSLERLTPEQRRAFARLAVFAGGFDARGAAAVLQRDRPATLGLLGALLDASLLSRRPPAAGQARFRMLEPLRDVARSTAAPAELAAAAERHAAFMSAEVERLCPAEIGIRTPEDHAQLRLEHPNLMAALGYLAESTPDGMVDLVWQLEDYWGLAGQDSAVLGVLESVVERGRASERAACLALTLLGRYRHLVGDSSGSRDALNRALAIAEHVEDSAARSRAKVGEAKHRWLDGDLTGARAAGRTALAEARRTGNDRLIARAILGMLWRLEVPHPQLKRLIAEVQHVARSRDALLLEGDLDECLIGYHAYIEDDLDAAADAARSALEIGRRFESPAMEAVNANNVALSLVRTGGSVAAARSMLALSLRTHVRMGHKVWALASMGSLGEVEAAAGAWRNALILIGSDRALCRRMQIVVNDSAEDAAFVAAQEHLGPEAAAEARAVGERMSYREALDFAFRVCEATGEGSPELPEGVDDTASGNPVLG